MKMDKVSPGFTDQPVQGFWSSITDFIQFNPGTGFGPWLVSVQVEFGLLRLVAAGTVFQRILCLNLDSQSRICPGQTV